jgi:hypothetical protein
MRLIRHYNSLLAFTSLDMHVDQSINTGSGPMFPYKWCGPSPNWVLLPADGSRLEYAQLYIYDTIDEVQNRLLVIPSE